jgi:chemotaxis protein CheX
MTTLLLAESEFDQMVGEIWSSLFDPAPHQHHLSFVEGDFFAGYVDISGGWHGRVVVETTDDGAVAIASSMFDAAPDTLGPADLADAVGELANIVGGSVKSCIDGESRLSLPAIERLEPVEIHHEGILVSSAVWCGHPLRVRVQPLDGTAEESAA